MVSHLRISNCHSQAAKRRRSRGRVFLPQLSKRGPELEIVDDLEVVDHLGVRKEVAQRLSSGSSHQFVVGELISGAREGGRIVWTWIAYESRLISIGCEMFMDVRTEVGQPVAVPSVQYLNTAVKLTVNQDNWSSMNNNNMDSVRVGLDGQHFRTATQPIAPSFQGRSVLKNMPTIQYATQRMLDRNTRDFETDKRHQRCRPR